MGLTWTDIAPDIAEETRRCGGSGCCYGDTARAMLAHNDSDDLVTMLAAVFLIPEHDCPAIDVPRPSADLVGTVQGPVPAPLRRAGWLVAGVALVRIGVPRG